MGRDPMPDVDPVPWNLPGSFGFRGLTAKVGLPTRIVGESLLIRLGVVIRNGRSRIGRNLCESDVSTQHLQGPKTGILPGRVQR